jgi:hypothetical protein
MNRLDRHSARKQGDKFMKKTSFMTLVVCLASVIGTAPAFAQSVAGLRLNLPYAVTVGNVTLPAGDCTVTDTKDNGHETFFVIRSAAGPAVDLMMARDSEFDSQSAAASAVELRHAGDKYQFAGLRIEGKSYKVSQ